MERADELRPLIAKRGQLKSQLTRFLSFLNNFDNNSRTVLELTTRLDKTEKIWDEFNSVQSDIELLDNSDAQCLERESFEEQYFSVITKAKQLSVDMKNANSNTNVNSDQNRFKKNVQLPTLTLRKFSGQYDEWQAFYDAFEALVNRDTSLTNTQKFMYLNSCLEGEAASATDSLIVTDDNYAIAWDILRDRYENKRATLNAHINAILDFPSMTKESHHDLRKLVDSVVKRIRALKNLGMSTETWDHLLINILTRKLDSITKREWEKSIKPREMPTMKDFINYLTNKCQMLETLESQNTPTVSKHNNSGNSSSSRFANNNRLSNKHSENRTLSHITTQGVRCNLCKGTHLIYRCRDFLKLPVKSRISEAKRLNLCTNCLKTDHSWADCNSGACRVCAKKHNSLLHLDTANTNVAQEQQSISAASDNNTDPQSNNKNQLLVSTHCAVAQQPYILLSTALIKVKGSNGNSISCRALLDSGSQSNFLSSTVAEKLGTPITKINWPVSGINQSSINIQFKTEASVKSLHNGYSKKLSFLILDQITQNIPTVSFEFSSLDIPGQITLADPNFNKSGSIDVLLGAEIFFDILCVGQIKLGPNKPILQKSHVGWIMSGPIFPNNLQSKKSICNLSVESDIQNCLEKFWQIEECSSQRAFTAEEMQCEENFVTTTKRADSGRFVVSLPKRDNHEELGESLELATKRFVNLERKFRNDPTLKTAYVDFLAEYESLGHMSKIDKADIIRTDKMTYYLPHHGVVKNSSLTTKLRVVFDASAKTTTDISLNDILMVGPTLQDELFSIITRFRKHNYVLIADIEKMYRQVLVSEHDRDLQRIVWRTDPEQTLEHYRLNTITYGTAPASFVAVRCLHELAYQHQLEFPIASKIILKDFYMDDLITGTDTIQNAKQLKHDIDYILRSGGFILRKWVTNEPTILDISQHDNILPKFYITDDSCVKTLGLLWNAQSDTLQFTISVNRDQRVTKRTILSTIAQIFDPLGLLGPAIIKVKIIIQQLWRLRLEWDEAVPLYIHTQFIQFRDQIDSLSKLEIPRQILHSRSSRTELHGFCDSSESAYGACIYLKNIVDNQPIIRLICAKSKVAPLKNVTLPRLELCAAVLLAQLSNNIIQSLDISLHEVFYWSDSTIVLSWISSPSNTWKTFVANRIAEIQRLTSIEHWHHVRSEDNPADVISRGVDPESLLNLPLWWSGPSWLAESAEYPQFVSSHVTSELPELKSTTCLLNIVDESIITRFSSFIKLQRVTAYCIRFKRNAINNKEGRCTGILSSEELNYALRALIRVVQHSSFHAEFDSLKKCKTVSPSSRLSSLAPFLDDFGIIRVGGRLSNSDQILYDKKYPIVLPHNNHFTRLLIRYEHIRLFHAGPQATLASIRTKFWPLRGRSIVNRVLHECITCFKVKPSNHQPLMGNLPLCRIQPARPFLNTGVDFAGPFQIKDVKAVHIEVVGDLTTESFLNALKRFISRRGICKNIFSDNGTNFRGADNALKQTLSKIDQESSVSYYLAQNAIQWHFSPARSPHFGGIWESAVKSAKFHSKRIIGNTVLTFEELTTMFVQIEAILNSRPLTPLSSDPSDLLTLSPSHFLIGDILTSIPEDVPTLPIGHLSSYKRIQQIRYHFWQRWKAEYISTLQQRSKWRKQEHAVELKPGMMVLVREENTPPLCWPLGRITAVHPGKDKIVRVVSVQMGNKVIVKRAVNKICVLPLEQELLSPDSN